MEKKKVIFYLVICFSFISLLTGCQTKKVDQQEENEVQKTEEAQVAVNRERGIQNFPEASISDIKIGETITVMGSESAGIVSASIIIIGEQPMEMMGQMPRMGLKERQPGEESLTAPTGNRPDISQFQNMSDEDRANFRQERMGQRGENTTRQRTGQRSPMTASETRIVGEVLEIENKNLTIKLEEGGSKIIFIGEKTEIRKIPEVNTAQGEDEGGSVQEVQE